MRKLVLVSILLAGCASVPPATSTTTVAEPTPIDPTLPSVDRIADLVHYTLGPVATTELELCVHPNGKLASVELVGGSALPAFDFAVVDDAATWRFTTLPGPAKLQTCETATIAYRAAR